MKRTIQTRSKGFSLIEILVVVVIIGILTAIALPQYVDYVNRAKRNEAATALRDAQQFLQRLYSANNSYQVNGAAPVLPAPMRTSPQGLVAGASNVNYGIGVVTPTAGSFTLTATRNPNGPLANDPCGDLTLDQRGTRGMVGASGRTVQNCWK